MQTNWELPVREEKNSFEVIDLGWVAWVAFCFFGFFLGARAYELFKVLF